MAGFVKGDVVVVSFPFSDLTSSKRRPALILAKSGASDYILSQITSKSLTDEHAIEIGTADFDAGGLSVISNLRPNKLFTAGASIIAYKTGNLKREKTNLVVTAINRLLENGV